jgi:hypothetical protein
MHTPIQIGIMTEIKVDSLYLKAGTGIITTKNGD